MIFERSNTAGAWLPERCSIRGRRVAEKAVMQESNKCCGVGVQVAKEAAMCGNCVFG